MNRNVATHPIWISSRSRSGRLLGTVAQLPSEMGRLGVKHAVELVRRGTMPPDEVLTRVELIDRGNVDNFAPPDDGAATPEER